MKLISAFSYPSGGFVDNYVPNNTGTPEFSEECQGLTAGPTDWFITSNNVVFSGNPTRLYRVPFNGDLGASTTWPYVEVPQALSSYDHFGDPVYYTAGEAFVLVPCDGDASAPDIVMRFAIPETGAPVFRDSAPLLRPEGVTSSLTAWAGYDPTTRLYYATEFCEISGLVIHCFEILTPFEFEYRGALPIRRTNNTTAAVTECLFCREANRGFGCAITEEDNLGCNEWLAGQCDGQNYVACGNGLPTSSDVCTEDEICEQWGCQPNVEETISNEMLLCGEVCQSPTSRVLKKTVEPAPFTTGGLYCAIATYSDGHEIRFCGVFPSYSEAEFVSVICWCAPDA